MNKFNNLSNLLKECTAWLQKEFKKISAGQANPAVLDSVNVESYGSYMPIAHVANISLDANSLKVAPWDKGQMKAVEQAIRDADLGVSLIIESDGIRVVFPQLTTETRAKYVKQAKEYLEEARIKVRQVRQDVISDIDAEKIAGNISEDDQRKKRDQIQKQVDEINKELEDMFKNKEAAIMKI
jgi:ribosome recycling factor